MSRIRRCLCQLLPCLLLMISLFAASAVADPVIVAQTGANADLSNSRQIVRTATGRIYYLSGNAGHTSSWDGWLEVHASGDGSSWSKESTRDQWYLGSDICVTIDNGNILHVVSYDWNHRPYYVRFNTTDSPTATSTWDGYELLDSTRTADVGRCAIAVDANGKPHVVYQSLESYKGKTYYTLTYANRVGTAWSKVAIWPKELKTSFSGKIEIAIGRDNTPYILTGNKIHMGNANAATSFETKDLGSAGTSFVIQQNGDIKVSQISNGKYAIHSHDHTLSWNNGWTLTESTTPDNGSILLLANDTLYAARLNSDGIWLQKNLDPTFLAVPQPADTVWQSLTARWSFYNHNKQGVIDLGTRSWNQQNGNLLWYSVNLADSHANFYGSPYIGPAPLTVSLIDSSIPREGSSITSWQWDINNDGTADASGPKITHQYTTPGKYSVSLAITDSSGGQDKIVMPNLIQVHPDSDGDGVMDPFDNCPNDYNPTQLDLNSNMIGDACEAPVNMLVQSMYMPGLRTITAADSRKSIDVTGIMTDGLLDQKVTLLPASKNALTVQVNKDAANIKKLIMGFYLNIHGNPLNSRVYIMPYNRDLTTTMNIGMVGGWSGWNEFDMTPILHRMDGFGQTKFRVFALDDPSGISIYEVNIKELVDNREINATPPSHDFGNTEVSTTSPPRDITISNNGADPVNIIRVKQPSWPFSLVSEDCTGKTLTSGNTCIVRLSFSPMVAGLHNSAVTIDSSDAEKSSLKVPLQGTGVLILRGVVKDLTSGKPLNAVNVEVTDSLKTHTTTTDINGTYAVSGLAAGNYTAKFSRADYITYSADGSSPINILDAQLSFNYASINGTVTDQTTGAPLPGVNVTLELSGFSSTDPADRQFSCNGDMLLPSQLHFFESNDDNKFVCRSISANWTFTNGVSKFKVRNPFGRDPFTIKWNGIAAMEGDNEYLAQKFIPRRSGLLNRVAFYLDTGVMDYFNGDMFVLLKTKLGGDRGTYLAKGNSAYYPKNTPGWIYFDFTEPVQVVAGEQYYLEINGTFYELFAGRKYLYNLTWSKTNDYPDGSGYRRSGGIWSPMESLAFQTFVDNQADINANPTTTSGLAYVPMYGSNDTEAAVAVKAADGSSSTTYGVPTNMNEFDDGGGYRGKYNGDDLTASDTFADSPELFYDTDGWIEVIAFAGSIYGANILTDQFSVTFNRTFTTTTDINGSYSFANLLSGNYDVSFSKAAYTTNTISGAISLGQSLEAGSVLSKAPTATLQGTVLGGRTDAPVGGAIITVTDPIGEKSAITDNLGSYVVSGIVPGTYSATVTAAGYYPKSVTGNLLPGQMVNIGFKPNPTPIIVTITSPSTNVLTVYTDRVTITGRAENATKVYAFDNNGTKLTVNVINDEFSLSVPLQKGSNSIYVSGENNFGSISNHLYLSIEYPTFILRNLGDIGNVSVMEFSDPSQYLPWTSPTTVIAQEYISSHGDNFDFLVCLSTFDHPLPVSNAKAYYYPIKNDVQGIGQNTFNRGITYGSNGKLQGIIDHGSFGSLTLNPYGPKLDETVLALNHELMHRWGAYVRFKNTDGSLNTSLFGTYGHWSYLLDSKGSLMYGNGWQNNGDGTFTATAAMSGFSPLDLYLAGMIPYDQVPPMTLIENPAVNKEQLPQLGAKISGTTRTVTIDNIMLAEGERLPNAATSQKQFKVGFLLLVRPGENPANAAAAVEVLRSAWAGKFAELTRGIGSITNVAPSLSLTIDSPTDNATITGPDVTVTGTVINSTGTETGLTVNGVPANVSGSRFIANHVTLQDGPNSIEIKATDANGLTTSATRSVTSQAGHYISISSNVDSGTGPLTVSFRLDSSFVVANPSVSISGPVPVSPVFSDSQTEFTAKFTTEGSYIITASAKEPDGQQHSDTVTFIVNNRERIDHLLRSKWDAVNSMLSFGKKATALQLFTSYSREKYQSIFDEIITLFPNIVATYRDLTLLNIGNGVAHYKLTTNESGAIYAYDIVFEQEENGLWLIRSY